MAPSRKLPLGDVVGVVFAIALFTAFLFVPVTKAEPENVAPAIDALSSSHDQLYGAQSCDLYCSAHDDDEDALTFVWSSTDGKVTPSGTTATWTAPRQHGSYAIMVEVHDGNEGYDTSCVIVTVARNQAPAINTLTCSPQLMLPGESSTVSCDASDPDDHALAYEWSSSSGTISGNGHTVTWTAPSAPGTYLVAVRVSDGLGGDSTRSALLSVAPATPPVIDELIVRPFLPEYTKEFPWGYRVLRGCLCECEIECVASAMGKELTYDWSCNEGSIEGSGPTVLFIPPKGQAEVHVTVTVSDSFGHSATGELFFKVFNREPFSDDSDEGGCGCRGW